MSHKELHADEHFNGKDNLRVATALLDGIMSAAQVATLEGLDSGGPYVPLTGGVTITGPITIDEDLTLGNFDKLIAGTSHIDSAGSNLRVYGEGSLSMTFSGTRTELNKPLRQNANGSEALPGYAFSDAVTGAFHNTTSSFVGFSYAGIETFRYTATQLRILESTPSTNPSTGALVVDGGVGLGGDLYVTGGVNPVAQASNPGGATTLWVNSADSNKLYFGASEVGGGGGGTPGGANGEVQYNNAGAFAGSSLFTFDENFGSPILTLNNAGTLQGGGDLVLRNQEVPDCSLTLDTGGFVVVGGGLDMAGNILVLNTPNAYIQANSSDTVSIYAGGDGIIDFDGTGASAVIYPYYQIQSIDGSISEPAYGFSSDTSTGMFSDGLGGIGFSAGSSQVLTLSGTLITMGVDLEVEGNVGFYNTTPVAQPTALTVADATATSGTDATVIDNIRTRVNELETKIQSLGLLA